MKKLYIILILISIPLFSLAQFEQYIQEDPEPTSNKRAGGTFTVLESGSGLGAFYEIPLPYFTSMGGALNAYMMRDNSQIDTYDYYGYPITIGKKNNAFLFDLEIYLKKRLFAYSMDDMFRPFISVSFGPVYGINFPEKDYKQYWESIHNGEKLKDQYVWAGTSSLALGIDILMDSSYMISFQFKYHVMYFQEELGEINSGTYGTADLRIEIGKAF